MGPRNLGWPVDRGLGTQYLRGRRSLTIRKDVHERGWLTPLFEKLLCLLCVRVLIHSPAQGIISYSSSSPETLDPQYDRASPSLPPPPFLSPFIYRDRRRRDGGGDGGGSFTSRMFSREKRNGEGEDSILFTSFNIAAYCESCSRLRI